MDLVEFGCGQDVIPAKAIPARAGIPSARVVREDPGSHRDDVPGHV
jgi:hypothetical protein